MSAGLRIAILYSAICPLDARDYGTAQTRHQPIENADLLINAKTLLILANGFREMVQFCGKAHTVIILLMRTYI